MAALCRTNTGLPAVAGASWNADARNFNGLIPSIAVVLVVVVVAGHLPELALAAGFTHAAAMETLPMETAANAARAVFQRNPWYQDF